MNIMGVNRAGVDWLMIKSWLLAEISNASSRLEDQQPDGSTQFERGQIAVLRRLLNEVEPVKQPEIEEENYG